MAQSISPRILAALWAGYSVLTNGVVLVAGTLFGTTCAPLFGGGNFSVTDPANPWVAITGGFACAVLAYTLVSLLICWGLARGARWGLWGALLLAILNLFAIPLGTALSIFTFVALKDELRMGGTPE